MFAFFFGLVKRHLNHNVVTDYSKLFVAAIPPMRGNAVNILSETVK